MKPFQRVYMVGIFTIIVIVATVKQKQAKFG
jgi:hypothetical protein